MSFVIADFRFHFFRAFHLFPRFIFLFPLSYLLFLSSSSCKWNSFFTYRHRSATTSNNMLSVLLFGVKPPSDRWVSLIPSLFLVLSRLNVNPRLLIHPLFLILFFSSNSRKSNSALSHTAQISPSGEEWWQRWWCQVSLWFRLSS